MQSPFPGACLKAVVELSALQLPGEFRERDFVFMQTFTYYCHICGCETISYWRLKQPHRCKDCARASGNANLKKHSKDLPLKKKLIKERGSTCEQCGLECKVMMHHKIEIRDGGETTPENCILLCQDCHKQKHGGRGVGSAEYWYDKRYP